MAVTNRDRIAQMLELVQTGLTPFVEREMKAEYKGAWIKQASYSLRDFDPDDPHFDASALLILMTEQWRDVFGKTLGHAERSLVSELRNVRNDWAHQRQFSTDDTYRALDSGARLLSAISAPEAQTLDRMRQELLRLRFEEQMRSEQRKASAAPIEGQPSSGLRPWRELATPHPDVASGRYQQAEFAADLWQVYMGEGAGEYSDPVEFFSRTFLTDGLYRLLVEALRRVNGLGGNPIVQLQTNFGGGKTHSMLALYHLFSGVEASRLAGLERTSITFSLDGAHAETFEKIRVGSNFEQVRNNLRKLVEYRGRAPRPEIKVWTVVTRQNLGELEEIVRLAAELGTDGITLQLFMTDWSKAAVRENVESQRVEPGTPELERALEGAREAARELGFPLTVYRQNLLSRQRKCSWPWTGAFIAANGDVVPCCVLADADTVKMGNVFETPFEEIWNSPGYQRLRGQIATHQLPEYCRNCYRDS